MTKAYVRSVKITATIVSVPRIGLKSRLMNGVGLADWYFSLGQTLSKVVNVVEV